MSADADKCLSGNKSPLKFFDINLPRIHFCQKYIHV